MKLNSPKWVFGIGGGVIILLLSIVLVIGILGGSGDDSSLSYAKFESCEQVVDRYNATIELNNGFGYPKFGMVDDVLVREEATSDSAGDGGAPGLGSSEDFSTTNNQVAGVDEADIVKTNGKNIFLASNRNLYILDSDLGLGQDAVVSKLSLNRPATGMFIYKDTLTVISEKSSFVSARDTRYFAPGRQIAQAQVTVFDISDPVNPVREFNAFLDGGYVSARQIDGVVYLVTSQAGSYYEQIDLEGLEAVLPRVGVAESDFISDSDLRPSVDCNQINYFGSTGNDFVQVMSFSVENPDRYSIDVTMGGVDNLYMSQNNLFITTTENEFEEVMPMYSCDPFTTMMGGCDMGPRVESTGEQTTSIFKLGLESNQISFAAAGQVPGRLLNQFSLDEHSGYLRVATTSTIDNRFNDTQNNMYVLDSALNQVGSLEGLAPEEQIYSVRYMGDRAYMVTFRQVDPLFVLDLSTPTAPKVLGELKIPGVSDYMHPYDENYIIGVGRGGDETGRVSGVKLSLFDVSDPKNPTEVDSVVLGGSGSYTQVINDHKAFLFDREKDLLVLPVNLYGVSDQDFTDPMLAPDQTDWFAGFVVFGVDSSAGFTERTRIGLSMEGEKYYSGTNMRSLYIGEFLYVMDSMQVKQLDMMKQFEENGQVIFGEVR